MQRTAPPFRSATEATVVTHKKDDGPVGFAMRFDPVHQIAEALVHPFDQGGIGRLSGVHSFVELFGIEAHVFIDGDMDGVVCHIKEEGLSVLLRLVEGADGFERKRLGREDVLAVIFFESRDGKGRLRTAIGTVSEVLFAEVTGQASRGMSRNVDFEAEMCGVFARRINGAEVCLSAMNGMVSVLFEQLYERGRTVSLFDTRHLADSVHIPLRKSKGITLGIGRLVAMERPIRHPVSCRVGSGEQAASRGRTDG